MFTIKLTFLISEGELEQVRNSMLKGIKVGVSEEEKSLSYYRFFEKDMEPVPEEKMKYLEEPQAVQAISFEERNMFLAGNDKEYCQIGYGIMRDGTGFVCNQTYMPGVTVEMLDFWFPWHSVGSDLRYKIWDPEDHYFARADRPDVVCDPSVPVRQKTWGVSHYILEDTGMGPEFLKLCFLRPEGYGYDPGLIGTKECASLVCAVGEGGCAAAMTHKWYPYDAGVILASRFWIGFGIVNGKIKKILPEGSCIPEPVLKGLYAHNIKEFTNLAAILPEVYAENKDYF